jgi:hypothetical protein
MGCGVAGEGWSGEDLGVLGNNPVSSESQAVKKLTNTKEDGPERNALQPAVDTESSCG